MSIERRENTEFLLEQTLQFLHLGEGTWVKYIALEEPKIGGEVRYWGLVSLFPTLLHCYDIAIFGCSKDCLEKVFKLELLQVGNDNEKADPALTSVLERFCLYNRFPSLVLAFGKIQATGENVTILCTVVGRDPELAMQGLRASLWNLIDH